MAHGIIRAKSKRQLRSNRFGNPFTRHQTPKVVRNPKRISMPDQMHYDFPSQDTINVNDITIEPIEDPTWVIKAFRGLSNFIISLLPKKHPNGDKVITDKDELMKINWNHVLRM